MNQLIHLLWPWHGKTTDFDVWEPDGEGAQCQRRCQAVNKIQPLLV